VIVVALTCDKIVIVQLFAHTVVFRALWRVRQNCGQATLLQGVPGLKQEIQKKPGK
jgi:hypothetical protein